MKRLFLPSPKFRYFTLLNLALKSYLFHYFVLSHTSIYDFLQFLREFHIQNFLDCRTHVQHPLKLQVYAGKPCFLEYKQSQVFSWKTVQNENPRFSVCVLWECKVSFFAKGQAGSSTMKRSEICCQIFCKCVQKKNCCFQYKSHSLFCTCTEWVNVSNYMRKVGGIGTGYPDRWWSCHP